MQKTAALMWSDFGEISMVGFLILYVMFEIDFLNKFKLLFSKIKGVAIEVCHMK